MIIVVLLQNCWSFEEGETGSCRQTCATCDVGGTEEVSIKVEEAVDTKDEIPEAISFPPINIEKAIVTKDETPEAISFPPIKAEQEVRLLGCV